MATVTYNGIAITNCKISRFTTENEFDNDNRNRTGKKHTLEGVGIYKNSSAFTTALADIRNTLNVPGKLLSIKFDDNATTMYLAAGSDESVYTTIRDTGKGPLPSVNITEITGGYTGTFVIGFSFTWHNCNSSPIQQAEITITHSIDEEGVSTIERRGFLEISESNSGTGGPSSVPVTAQTPPTSTRPYSNITDLNMATGSPATYSASPSDYRQFVSGLIPKGFRRTKQEFYVEADQKTLVFHIIDQQVAASLPFPALSGDASFDYERGIEGNEIGRKVFRCNLIGPPIETSDDNATTPGATDYRTMRASLFFRALEIALTRIRFMPPNPDTVVSFKVAEPSLFKRNEIVVEITAWGSMVNTPQNEAVGAVDGWLYKYLFSHPNPSRVSALNVPAYGFSTFGAGYQPKFKFDPCTLANTWVTLTGTTQGTAVALEASDAQADGLFVDPNERGDVAKPAQTGEQPDEQLVADAPAIFSYRASQSVGIDTRFSQMETMGGEHQFSFQMSLPKVIITQTVEMSTRVRGIAVPWPKVDDRYAVVSQDIQMNDGPPDASGNRIIAIRATRRLQVSVANSAHLRRYIGGESGPNRAVWMPETLQLPRNPYSGSVEVTNRENRNGTIAPQDYLDPSSTGG
jgi:hypothetical protein